MGRRHPYTWGQDHPLVIDGILALALAAAGIATEVGGTNYSWEREPDDLSGVLTLATTLPLVLRRRHPLAVFLVIFAFAVVYFERAYPGGGPIFGLLVSVYGVGAYVGRWAAAAGVAALMLLVGLGHVVEDEEAGSGWDVLVVGAVMTTAAVLGDNMRVRRDHVAAVEDRAVQLEREQDAQARRAVLEERTRIARELHDVVAHSMSVMVVQAGAARRVLERDPSRAAEAIGQIESTGRGALAEMRRLVGVLRSDQDEDRPPDGHPDSGPGGESDPSAIPASTGPDRSVDLPLLGGDAGGGASLLPQPGIDGIPALVEQCREVGLEVGLRVDGSERPLPSGVELVVYRVVQEALTNTLRHAGPARADVHLRYGEARVEVTVTDDGRGAASDGPASGPGARLAVVTVPENGLAQVALMSGPGHGLTGMYERVSLYGGRFSAGPRTGGGFRVWAEIPLPDAEADGGEA